MNINNFESNQRRLSRVLKLKCFRKDRISQFMKDISLQLSANEMYRFCYEIVEKVSARAVLADEIVLKRELTIILRVKYLLQSHLRAESIQILTQLLCMSITEHLCELEAVRVLPESVEARVQRIISMEIRLSRSYLLLASILKSSPALHAECLLTAFSLKPGWGNYNALFLLGTPVGSDNVLKEDPLDGVLDRSTYEDILTVVMQPRIKSLQWSPGSAVNWSECKRLARGPRMKVDLLRRSMMTFCTPDELNARLINEKIFARLINVKRAHATSRFACLFDENSNVSGFVSVRSSDSE